MPEIVPKIILPGRVVLEGKAARRITALLEPSKEALEQIRYMEELCAHAAHQARYLLTD